MTIIKSVALAIFTIITLNVLAYVFDTSVIELSVVFLIGQGAAITVHIGIITGKLNEKGR